MVFLFSDLDCILRYFKMILNIPDELLVKIMSNLTIQDLLQNVALVNKRFQQIAMDANTLKTIVLHNIDEHVYQNFENVLSKARNLNKLTLKSNVLHYKHLIQVALETSKNLKSLKIIHSCTKRWSNLKKFLHTKSIYFQSTHAWGNSKLRILKKSIDGPLRKFKNLAKK